MLTLFQGPAPVAAAVNGHARAGGCDGAQVLGISGSADTGRALRGFLAALRRG